MPRYVKYFKKTVWGYLEVEAKDKKEADKKLDDADYDEFDNKSEYEFENEEWQEENE